MKKSRIFVSISQALLIICILNTCQPKTAMLKTSDFLIDECAQAMGGTEKIDAWHTMRFSQYLPDHGGKSTYEIMRPDHVRLGDLLVFDGGQAFWLSNGESVRQEELTDFEVDIAWYIPAFFDYPAENLGPEIVGAIKKDRLQVTLPLGAIMTYYLDTETHLIYRAVADFTLDGTEYHPERIYGDYQLIDGIIYPHTFTYEGRMGGVYTATLQSIEFNIPLADERFSAPSTGD